MTGLYFLRKKIQEDISWLERKLDEINGTSESMDGQLLAYKEDLTRIDAEIFRLESRKKELKEGIKSRGRMGKVMNGERISELNFVLGEKE